MRAMTRSEALEFLATATRTGKLATASPVGDVHVAPVWFVVAGDSLVFMTHHNTVKARHLTANPRAALTADSDTFPYDFALVRGAVTVERAAADLGTWSHRIAARYVPADRADEFGRRNAVPGEWLCRLSIDRVVGRWGMAD